MNIVLSFIGVLPRYIVDCVHQIRCFSTSPIYVIINDQQSQYVSQLLKYNVQVINYEDVIDVHYISTVNKNIGKFAIIPKLGDRSHLFIRAFERFFLLHILMKSRNLNHCFFMEIDNLIYDDPLHWIKQFSTHELCYMYDNTDRCSSGIMYIKQGSSLEKLLDFFISYINTSHEFLNEMTCLYRYHALYKDEIQLLPIYWKNETTSELAYKNRELYGDSLFDGIGMGYFLLGGDPYHHNGKLVTGLHSVGSAINYTKEKFEWKKDEKDRNKPYIWNGQKWLLINNLHVHSKVLTPGLSLPV